MKYFYDCEFVEDGKTIDLISIGMVAEDGREYYAHSAGYDVDKAWAHGFVSKHVMPHLAHIPTTPRIVIRDQLAEFLREGPTVELWGWFSAWDHMALCQLWGNFDAQPSWLPRRTNDVAQETDQRGVFRLPRQISGEHDALADARWTKHAHDYVMGLTRL